MGFNLGNGLAALGQWAGEAGLQAIKADAEKQQTILASQLAEQRQEKQNEAEGLPIKRETMQLELDRDKAFSAEAKASQPSMIPGVINTDTTAGTAGAAGTAAPPAPTYSDPFAERYLPGNATADQKRLFRQLVGTSGRKEALAYAAKLAEPYDLRENTVRKAGGVTLDTNPGPQATPITDADRAAFGLLKSDVGYMEKGKPTILRQPDYAVWLAGREETARANARLAADAANPNQKPDAGYRWDATHTKQEYIPGGPADPTTARTLADSRRPTPEQQAADTTATTGARLGVENKPENQKPEPGMMWNAAHTGQVPIPGASHDPNTIQAEATARATGTAAGSPDKFDKPIMVEADDGQGGKMDVLAAWNRITHDWVTADKAGTSLTGVRLPEVVPGGGRSSTIVSRILNSAKDSVTSLDNLMHLPARAGGGYFGALGQTTNLAEVGKRYFAAKVTTQEVKDANTTFIGLGKAIATLDASGVGINKDLIEQMQGLRVLDTDNQYDKMRKIGEIRQLSDNALESAIVSPMLTREQKTYAQGLRDKIAALVPWSPNDVSALEQSRNPQDTLMDMARKSGVAGKAAAPAATPPQAAPRAAAPPAANGWTVQRVPTP
jgi:hypothetical protein